MTPLDGELGRYRLARLIGKGGMGEVYLARDPTLERDVAIKVLPADHAADRSARRRLLHEAQAAAQLDHPCICPVFEIGESPDGRTFIAMPYLHGETLAARLERGPLPVREALGLAQHVAEALCVAHAHGIVHRDLKPQNVMLTQAGLPKLLDFGVAKLRQSGSAAAEVSTASGDTATGAVVGTPAYMAPEQVAGQEVDERCDLFALGAVVFECLTGRRAFEGRTLFEVAAAVSHSTPPAVSALRREVPPGVDDLCARLLQKDAIDRFQTATEVVGALRLLSTSSDARFAPHPPRQTSWYRARRAWIATAVVVAGLVIGFLVRTAPAPLPDPPEEAARWYRRGTDFLREGAYHSANEALEQATRVYADYPLAYARQAEALSELDDQARASERLLRMQTVLGDEGRLASNDRLRLRGIRATVLRDLPQAVDAYRQLVDRTPQDAGAWVDLGRAQEAAEQRSEARVSYTRALTLDRALAPAHLRLASLDAQASRRDDALKAYADAERLYKAASNVEGETEVLLRRGGFLDAAGGVAQARQDLERALALAAGSGSRAQLVRARLALGSLMVSAGEVAKAEGLVTSAIDDARRFELWTLVADGLIELASLLVDQPQRLDEADRHAQEAGRLATARGAQRTATRATLQRAALALQRAKPGEARELAVSILPFLADRGYRRLELQALSILSRAERRLDDLVRAQETATRVLQAARDLRDEAQLAEALVSLAAVANASGDLPAALDARTEAEGLNQRMGRQDQAPFDLASRAELLIRLGRGAEAEPLLRAFDAGLRSGHDAFKGRESRLNGLRALAAVVADDLGAVIRSTNAAGPAGRPLLEGIEGAFRRYALARLGRPPGTDVEPVASGPAEARELAYWQALTASARGDHAAAASHVARGLPLAEKVHNDELTWRLAAAGRIAARAAGDSAAGARLKDTFDAARARLAAQWQGAFKRYDARPDLVRLRTAVAGTPTQGRTQ